MYKSLTVAFGLFFLAIPACVPRQKEIKEDSVAISVREDLEKFNKPYEGVVEELRYTKKN